MSIFNYFAKLRVEIQRAIDHLWLHVRGMPQVKRSMLTKNLFLGGQYSLRRISSLKKLGITAIVNMRMSAIHNPTAQQDFRILHLPTPDFHAPTLENLRKGVQFMDEEIKKGGSVYVHCHWGEGRGPSMVIAYLMFTGMTFQDAYEFVKKVRTFIRPTTTQIDQLRQFEKELAT